MEERASIVFSSAISNWTERNSSFDGGVLRVAYAGKNRNGSYISKDAFERCIDSIYNCPIVCRYDRDEDDLGAHDAELVETSDGGLRIVNVTQPVGVVPESARYWWEEIEDDSGTHEYLCVDVLIWKRQEAYQKIKRDGIVGESMEISIKDARMKDGVYEIDRFEFNAFCLLGSMAEPCFESAALEMFSYDSLKAQIADMMRELKEEIFTEQHAKDVAINKDPKGGEGVLDQKVALMEEFGLSADSLDFSLDDFTLDELREKFEAMVQSDDDGESGEEQSFALESQVHDELVEAIESERVERTSGDWTYTLPKYWFVDYDKDLMEVYGESSEDWNLYGFSYSMDGDHAVIDWESRKRMKIALVEYDEGSSADPFSRVFTSIEGVFTNERGDIMDKYQKAESEIGSMQSELDTLRQFKQDAEEAEKEEARSQMFAKFADLAGVEAFEALRADCADYSAEELEEKCYAIRGRQAPVAKFTATEQKAPKIHIDRSGKENEPYGGLFEKYGFTAPDQGN